MIGVESIVRLHTKHSNSSAWCEVVFPKLFYNKFIKDYSKNKSYKNYELLLAGDFWELKFTHLEIEKCCCKHSRPHS